MGLGLSRVFPATQPLLGLSRARKGDTGEVTRGSLALLHWKVLLPPTLQIPAIRATSSGLALVAVALLVWTGQEHPRASGVPETSVPRARDRAQGGARDQQQVCTPQHLSGSGPGLCTLPALLWLSVAVLASLQPSDEAGRCILG